MSDFLSKVSNIAFGVAVFGYGLYLYGKLSKNTRLKAVGLLTAGSGALVFSNIWCVNAIRQGLRNLKS